MAIMRQLSMSSVGNIILVSRTLHVKYDYHWFFAWNISFARFSNRKWWYKLTLNIRIDLKLSLLYKRQVKSVSCYYVTCSKSWIKTVHDRSVIGYNTIHKDGCSINLLSFIKALSTWWFPIIGRPLKHICVIIKVVSSIPCKFTI